MRILVTLKPVHSNIVLPNQYNYIIQSMLLKWLNDEAFSRFIHDTGYKYEKRNYKLYCFSRLFGRHKYNEFNKTIIFDNSIKFFVSSAIPEFIQYLIRTSILEDTELILWNQLVKIESIEIVKELEFTTEHEFYTLSPITVYSTFMNAFGKKTYYYNPTEFEFYELIKKNIIKKYIAYYGVPPENQKFEVKNINNKYKEKVIIYKGNFMIKAYEGEFKIKGNPELIKLAYQAGLSSKNPQGLGLIEFKERRWDIL